MCVFRFGSGVWVVKVREDDGELRPWHHVYVYSIERRLIMRVSCAATRSVGSALNSLFGGQTVDFEGFVPLQIQGVTSSDFHHMRLEVTCVRQVVFR